MATIIDSYSESNQDSSFAILSNQFAGQSFTGDGSTLGYIQFYIQAAIRIPSGNNIVAKIYAHTGIFGSSGVPTGSALATSDIIDANTLITSYELRVFPFSGGNQIILTNGVKYFVTIEYSGSETFNLGRDTTSPTHSGNGVTKFGAAAWGVTSSDFCFYVYNNVGSASYSPSASRSPSASLSPSSSLSASRSPSASLSASLSPSSSVSLSISPSSSLSPSASLSPSSSVSLSISPSSSVSLSISPSASLSPSSSVSLSISPSSSLSPSASGSISPSSSLSPSSSVSASRSPSVSLSPSASISPSSSISASRSPSSSVSPSPAFKLYSKQSSPILPLTEAPLSTLYSSQEYVDVANSNNIRVSQSTFGEYAIHQFRDVADPGNSAAPQWEGQSNLAPSVSPVVLQIFNQITDSWETIAFNDTAAANVDFVLNGIITDLTNYKDVDLIVSFRVYQLG